MNAPEGALTRDQCLGLKACVPGTRIYLVSTDFPTQADRWGIIHGVASEFLFSCGHPEYYFTNYLLAIGYALRLKARNHA